MDQPPTSTQTGSRCWTLTTRERTLDLEVRASDDTPLSAVLAALAELLGPAGDAAGVGLWSGPELLEPATTLADPKLSHGASLGLDGPRQGPQGVPVGSALALEVIGGPDAGRSIPLTNGRHVVGRGADADVVVDDPEISRTHAVVEVAGGTVSVADAGSANGSLLDDVALDEFPRTWPQAAIVRLGTSALTVRGPSGAVLPTAPAGHGRTEVRAGAWPALLRLPVDVPLPAEPPEPTRRRLAWVAIALPLVAGVGAAWIFSAPTFLFFALLSPLMALGNWSSDRWSGRRTHRREVQAFAVETARTSARLARAVHDDRRAADAALPDLAQLAAAVTRRSGPLWSRQRSQPDALTVRLGRAAGDTRVSRVAADGTRAPHPAADLPVSLDLAVTGGLTVEGPRPLAVRLLSGLLAQAAVLLGPGDLGFAVLTTADHVADWAWLRWLPHLPTSAVRIPDGSEDDERDALAWLAGLTAQHRTPDRTASPGRERECPSLVLVVDRPVDPQLAAALRTARDVGLVVLAPAEIPRDTPGAVLRMTSPTGLTADLVIGERAVAVRVDLLPVDLGEELARSLAPLTVPAGAGTLPDAVRLVDLLAPERSADGTRRPALRWSRRRDALIAVLGRSAAGVHSVDLCREGPHALVAGTTGAGKSELLQSLIAGLAAASPPDRCSFLLVDYKGGAAFAEAAAFPHTVGLVTDLDARSTTRALRSLGAELTRRESILAAAGVADIAALPDDVALARLVIVVDEFAGLAEELPEFVPGLVAIAQRGRSLGVHLVLATQRPAGVVSPEIRANCSLRLCLRTTDEADSRDVLGTGAAATLPVDLPGRAFLRTGAGTPTLLQIARIAGRAASGTEAPRVGWWSWPRGLPPTDPGSGNEQTDLSVLAEALGAEARRRGIAAPPAPWSPPLPDRLPAVDVTRPDGADRALLPLGLVDRPHLQRQEVLFLDLDRGGGWIAVGGPGSGRTTFLRSVLAQAVTTRTPADLHVHVIDSGGGAFAAEVAGVAHVGTAVGADDALRLVRLVDRLTDEVAARRATQRSTPALLLLVDGTEAALARLDDADPTRGSAALLRLMREGAAAGLTCVLTADRAVPGGRLAAAATEVLVLPLRDRADYGIAGIPARSVPEHRPPGRAVFGEHSDECQLFLPPPLPDPAPRGAPRSTALRIPELPADLRLPLPGRAPDPGRALRVPLGPGGDEGALQVVDLLRSGGLLVAGPPGSGRSAVLAAVVGHLCAAGAPVLTVVGRGSAFGSASPRPRSVPTVASSDVAGWSDWLGTLDGRPAVVCIDDYAAVAEDPVPLALSTVLPDGVALLVSGTAADLSSSYRGPLAALRRRRSGLLLCPGPGDADLLSVRLPRTPLPVRPGSGWLVASGVPRRIQVALHRDEPAGRGGTGAVPQSRSSSGPSSCVAYQPSS